MQGETDESNASGDAVDLEVLARRLVVEGMPIQRVIGEEAGVSQSTVSRAIGRSIGQTPGARKLWQYAEARLMVLRTGRPPSTGASEKASPMEGPRKRSPRGRRLADESGDQFVPVAGAGREELEHKAITGLREYLDDRFDPLLVIEQLAVLRRAQDCARRARPPGRTSVRN